MRSDAIALPMHLQTALLRIAQGAIANVVQHAQASSATIALVRSGDALRFTIADDGIGFDPATSDASGTTGSFGLRAAAERVEQLGGTLTVDAAAGRGTVLAVDLRIEAAA